MGVRDFAFLAAIGAGVGTLGAGLARPSRPVESGRPAIGDDLHPVVVRVDAAIRREWEGRGLAPSPEAADLAVSRRLSLALIGSIPSLEEVRRFEATPREGRVTARLEELLRDRRAADYLAERLARAFVGTEDGPFLRFRRRRFVAWLGEAIEANRPYDAIVRDLIADRGLWTDHPATNFVTVTFDPLTEAPDPERLAARVSRAFLGSRIDCAQCHDHPFQPWKQEDFRGLAAFFGGATSGLKGTDDGDSSYRPLDRTTHEPESVAAKVPALPELCPEAGSLRERLASWVVDPRNPALSLATTNRVWALMFGRPLVEPIDDLPDRDELPEALTILADDFSAHGFDLHRLIRAIVATEAFRRDSTGATELHETTWAAFPLSRMRPEQVAGALYQSSSLAPVGPESHWFFRLIASTKRNDFVRRYGDTGEDEFDSRGGTIPQRLLLMNGDLVRERLSDDMFSAGARIAMLAPDDRMAVEAAYLAILTRRPSAEEADHFADRLRGSRGDERKARMGDLCWTLLNSTEFSWNH